MPRETLKQLGLSDNEVKIYMTCLSLDSCLASTIAKHSGIKRTTVYSIIEKLSEKGILTYFVKNKTRYYHALNPDALLQLYKLEAQKAITKIKMIEDIIPALNMIGGAKELETKVSFFDSRKSVMNMVRSEFAKADGKEVLEYAASSNVHDESIGDAFLQGIKDLGLSLRTIDKYTDYNSAKKFIEWGKRHGIEEKIRFVNDKNYNPNGSLIIKGDSLFMVYFGKDRQVAIKITSKVFADMLRCHFELIWKNAKKLEDLK